MKELKQGDLCKIVRIHPACAWFSDRNLFIGKRFRFVECSKIKKRYYMGCALDLVDDIPGLSKRQIGKRQIGFYAVRLKKIQQ